MATVALSGTRFDVAPLGPGPNWVTHADPVTGVGLYVRAIAHALIRERGMPESQAIAVALGAVKRWASGGGKVHPEVRARAAEAVKHWEELKAIAHGESAAKAAGHDRSLPTAALSSRSWYVFDQAREQIDKAKAVTPTWDAHAEADKWDLKGHDREAFAGGYDAARRGAIAGNYDTERAHAASADALANAKGHEGQLKLTFAGMAMGYTHHADELKHAGQRDWATWDAEHAGAGVHHSGWTESRNEGAYAERFSGHTSHHEDVVAPKHRYSIKVGEHHDGSKSIVVLRTTQARQAKWNILTSRRFTGTTQEAKDFAERRVQDDIAKNSGEIVVHRDAIGEWGAGGPPNADSSGVANLLPVGPSKKQAQAIDDELERHRFKGTDLRACATCGRAVTDPIHVPPRRAAGIRHAGPGHAPVPTGHVKGNLKRHLQADKAQHERDADTLEGPLTEALQRFFADQRKSTLTRLNGKRGKQMLKAAGVRADQGGAGGPEPGSLPQIGDAGTAHPAPIAAGAGAGIDVSAIFDSGFWNDKLAQVLQPYYDNAATLAAYRVKGPLALPLEFDDSSSLGAAKAFLANRGNMTSPLINETTYQQIVAALQDAIDKGEGQQEMAKRVNALFDTADKVRAQRIAQTETISALNGSAHAYVSSLPEGVVARQRWMAHHDTRTRPTHRAADGQSVNVGMPFYVGGFPMLYPGDPAAPPGEVINCRCAVAYLPPGMADDRLGTVAAQLHAATAKALGVNLSPEAAQHLATMGA